jgi:ribose-phosphate pyrophosphokinase
MSNRRADTRIAGLRSPRNGGCTHLRDMVENAHEVCIVTTDAGAGLAGGVAGLLGVPVLRLRTERFANGNLLCRAEGLDVEGRDVALLQGFPGDVSDRVLELLFALRALAAGAPRRLTVVLPYVPYSRSDTPEARGEPVPARLLAELIECAGAQRLVAFDLHSPQLAGFFRIPVVELSARSLLTRAIGAWSLERPVVVSPDLGGAKRAARFAADLGCPLALVIKQRLAGRAVARGLAGEVRGHAALLFDDEIATGGTLVAAAELLLERGARSVHAVATHGVLAGDAVERLEASPLARVLVTDSVPVALSSPKLEVVSVAGELAAFLRGAAR